MKTEEQITAEFRSRIRNRRDGFEAAQERVHREITAERRRSRFTIIPAGRLARIAALLVLGLGAFFAWQTMHRNGALPLCPHSAKVEKPKNPYVAGEGADFLEHPELYERICRCSPRYSGSLR